MRRLTNEELSEPDVTLVIPNKIWAGLSDEIKDTLAMFWIDEGDHTKHVYTVPAYRAREFEEIQQLFHKRLS